MDYGRKNGRKEEKKRRRQRRQRRLGGRKRRDKAKERRVDFLLVSCVSFLGVALLYINKRKRVFICVWLLAEDCPLNSDLNGMYKMML